MTIRVAEVIKKKRDGQILEPNEIRFIIKSYTAGDIPDYQISALLMAIFLNGFSNTELGCWTDAMLHSGVVLNHENVSAPKVDKHSTGGVGDKISIPLAPAVAACGVPVPMISGRGLGHTGGTLDKLESIPGFNVHLDIPTSKSLLEQYGLFLIGQTKDVAPADRKLYALRDVTGTVESIPLIASSIMSKKLAEGIDGLVLDVKFGAGAFMKDFDQAKELAQTLISIGKTAGKEVHGLLTNMNTPLGAMVGNALEIRESIDVLNGGGPPDVKTLTLELGAQMLLLGKKARTADEGRQKIQAVLQNGKALALFSKVIAAQGGNPDVCERPDLLPTAKHKKEIVASRNGFVSRIDPMAVAMSGLSVNAGRAKKEDAVDPATGVELLVKPGDAVNNGQPIAILHHNGTGEEAAMTFLNKAIKVADEKPIAEPLIKERLV